MNLDAYMDDYGRDLHRAAKRKRPTRRRLAIAIPAATALTAVGVIALPRGDGIDAIAEARQALAPTDEIVHMVVEFKPQARPAKRGQPVLIMPKTEQWYSAKEKRWRTRMEGANGSASRFPSMEQISVGDTIRMYDKRRDKVTIFRGIKILSVGATGPGPGMTGGDPATELRKQLDAGDIRDDGVVTHDGKQVRRLVREENRGKRITQRFVYYMDPQSFKPLGGRMYFNFNQKRMFMSEFVISTYERIPLNAESAKLLRFEKTPNTKYVWRDMRKPMRAKPAQRVR